MSVARAARSAGYRLQTTDYSQSELDRVSRLHDVEGHLHAIQINADDVEGHLHAIQINADTSAPRLPLAVACSLSSVAGSPAVACSPAARVERA